jgi:hypothetical protein
MLKIFPHSERSSVSARTIICCNRFVVSLYLWAPMLCTLLLFDSYAPVLNIWAQLPVKCVYDKYLQLKKEADYHSFTHYKRCVGVGSASRSTIVQNLKIMPLSSRSLSDATKEAIWWRFLSRSWKFLTVENWTCERAIKVLAAHFCYDVIQGGASTDWISS